ncbi:EscU/YscU/HrcU family type III secretion system export apparatus switch protein [Catenovulum sp. SM1970]|uniref:EscU/YscU/HrcU family type III secretion system export apparatus switch protein n=1 Tax=Marinifaba aquimaris TaxID=2741323 RepID=UPI001572FD4A|nr:EscU/YscU/HrcU family type III secretion system export apparatus switch protein [Marinifaba aquimaris]NTS76369.1 EscU/YscU/HrcU family type III secretion system export apparatus switch protein [Marinifaba aquimaris]
MKQSDKKAVALEYSAPKPPEVVAKGFGELAEEIASLAEQSGVMLHKDDELANYLARLDVGNQIPKDVYYIIAEIIAWSYVIRGKQPDKFNNIHGRIDHKA